MLTRSRLVDGPSIYARAVANIAAVDPIIAKTARAIGAAAKAAYVASSPSKRVGKAVRSSVRKVGPDRIVRTGVIEKPLGPPVHGRDVGTQAIARWTDEGTADGGEGFIYRTTRGADGHPLPFTFLGRPIPYVRGQAAQEWVRPAREAADGATEVLVDDMGQRIDRALGR